MAPLYIVMIWNREYALDARIVRLILTFFLLAWSECPAAAMCKVGGVLEAKILSVSKNIFVGNHSANVGLHERKSEKKGTGTFSG